MHIVHKLFDKYGRATPLEALPVRAIRTSHLDLCGRYTRRHSSVVKLPKGTRRHPGKRCIVCLGKKQQKDTIQMQEV
jgi:hypothetical protein